MATSAADCLIGVVTIPASTETTCKSPTLRLARRWVTCRQCLA